MRRQIMITAFEQERLVSYGILTHCPVCCAQSELLTLPQAAALAQVEEQSIWDWLAEGRMHSAMTPGGDQRICKKSLLIFSEWKGQSTD